MQEGSQEAFTTLYLHYSPRLYTNLLRIVRDPLLTEEIIQELFTRVWQKRELPGMQENFSGYLVRIGQHLVHDFFRKLQRDRRLLERFRAMAEKQDPSIEEELFRRQTEALLQQALSQLSPQQQVVYKLVKQDGCSYKRAAEIMGISPLTVKEYLVATKKSIRRYLLSNLDTNLLALIALAQIW